MNPYFEGMLYEITRSEMKRLGEMAFDGPDQIPEDIGRIAVTVALFLATRFDMTDAQRVTLQDTFIAAYRVGCVHRGRCCWVSKEPNAVSPN